MTTAAPPLPTNTPLVTVGGFRLRERLATRGRVEHWTAEDSSGAKIVVLTELLPTAGTGEWPSLAWEEQLRSRAEDLGLAGVCDRFEDDGRAYLALEQADGGTLWDVWDDPC